MKGGHGDGDGWCDKHECELTEEMRQRTEKKTRTVSDGVMEVAERLDLRMNVMKETRIVD